MPTEYAARGYVRKIDLYYFLQVLLKTTAGDIDIELWSKEAPKACRNFIQLCMEGNDQETKYVVIRARVMLA